MPASARFLEGIVFFFRSLYFIFLGAIGAYFIWCHKKIDDKKSALLVSLLFVSFTPALTIGLTYYTMAYLAILLGSVSLYLYSNNNSQVAFFIFSLAMGVLIGCYPTTVFSAIIIFIYLIFTLLYERDRDRAYNLKCVRAVQ